MRLIQKEMTTVLFESRGIIDYNMNQTVLSQELVLKYESWKVLREIVPYEFFIIHAAIQPRNYFREQVFNPAVSLI